MGETEIETERHAAPNGALHMENGLEGSLTVAKAPHLTYVSHQEARSEQPRGHEGHG